MQPEPVSPELVLIDPELARRERARLEETAYLQSVLDVPALRRVLDGLPPPIEEVVVRRRPLWREATAFSKRRLVPAALLCSLLANGLFVAHVLARKGEEATPVAVRMVTLTESAASTQATSSGAATAPQKRLTAPTALTKKPTTKGAVERRVVSLILSAPARKLPSNFIDRSTGLVKNNVQVVCSKKTRRSYLCAIRLSSGNGKKALYVRYRMTKGQGVFKWYGYRRS